MRFREYFHLLVTQLLCFSSQDALPPLVYEEHLVIFPQTRWRTECCFVAIWQGLRKKLTHQLVSSVLSLNSRSSSSGVRTRSRRASNLANISRLAQHPLPGTKYSYSGKGLRQSQLKILFITTASLRVSTEGSRSAKRTVVYCDQC